MRWILLILSLAFAYMTFDAWRLRASDKRSFSLRMQSLGISVEHLPPDQLRAAAVHEQRHGLGHLSSVVVVFAVLSIGFAIATVATFL